MSLLPGAKRGAVRATLHGNEIGAMHIGMLGTMAQLYLSDLREKTWRGQLGRALQGKLPGGKAYGYDVVVPRDANAGAGERLINPAEAAIVRRIFEEFAAGHSPRAIAKRLNKERVRGPGGRPWGDTTIRGQAARGNGILNNALYAGRLEWNRCGYMKDPRTGKRVARPNPREKWEVISVPKLRIVDDKLWNRVKARQKTLRVAMSRQTSGNALNRAHRRRYLLSGLLVCGLCGGGYTIVGQDRYGCANHRSKGTCSNALAINRKELEERVLSALRERLLAPELVADFVGAFNAEVKRIASEADGERERARRTVSDTERKIAAVIKAIEDGAYNTALKERLAALETEKATAATVLTGAKPPLVVRLHPNLPALYRKKVERLAEALGRPETAAEAGEIIRTLIERIVFSPQGNSLTAQLFGDFVKLANFAESADMKNKNAGSRRNPALLSVVAGGGFEPPTFRL